jgi:flagellar hook-basal body complex protein FliE
MDIKSIQALQGYTSAPKAQSQNNATSTQSAFGQAAHDFSQTLSNAEETAVKAMTGNADPHALVEALANTQIAVETAVTVRDRVVEAYQEILRMPV